MTRQRRGATLVELLVALTLLGIVGSAALAAVRMQTAIRMRVGSRVTAAVREQEALTPLMVDLMVASPAAGDIPPAGGTDSTLDLQATVATGYTCDDTVGARGLTVAILEAAAARSVAAGDSVRLYAAAPDGWRSAVIRTVVRSSATAGCPVALDAVRLQLTIDSAARAGVVGGAPVHVTRRIRYSFYRAPDGGTYLGMREWSEGAGRLATVQPIAGPFDTDGGRFAYLDSAGRMLGAPVTPDHVAAIEVRLGAAARIRSAGAPPVGMRILGLRNRR